MKPKDENIVVVTHRAGMSLKTDRSRKVDHRYSFEEVRAKSSNPFFKPATWYCVYILPGGFKIALPSLESCLRQRKSTKSGHIVVTGAEPGIYDIVEQTEDFVICKKQSI